MKSSHLLNVEHVSRDFRAGTVHAVRDVSLHIDDGEIVSLVGVNGAGKTTLVKMCSTLLAPASGNITVNGIDAVKHPKQARRSIGLVLGGDRGFYQRSTVRSNMKFFADLAEVPYARRDEEILRCLELVELADFARTPAGELSRGQHQRLHIARALLGSPSLLLLDEPTIGLDPDVALRIRDVIGAVAKSGVGILLTSHSMEEVQELATRVAIMDSGSIRREGSLNDIYQYAKIYKTSIFSLPASMRNAADVPGWFSDEGYVMRRAVGTAWRYTLFWKREYSEREYYQIIDQTLRKHGCSDLQDYMERNVNLEDAFLSITQQERR